MSGAPLAAVPLSGVLGSSWASARSVAGGSFDLSEACGNGTNGFAVELGTGDATLAVDCERPGVSGGIEEAPPSVRTSLVEREGSNPLAGSTFGSTPVSQAGLSEDFFPDRDTGVLPMLVPGRSSMAPRAMAGTSPGSSFCGGSNHAARCGARAGGGAARLCTARCWFS